MTAVIVISKLVFPFFSIAVFPKIFQFFLIALVFGDSLLDPFLRSFIFNYLIFSPSSIICIMAAAKFAFLLYKID